MSVLSMAEVYQLVKNASPADTPRPRMVWAASIAYMESDGNTSARNFNNGKSTDRGLWQWNDKAWPNITTAVADDPVAATKMAYEVSRGWTDFTPWSRKKDKSAFDRLIVSDSWTEQNVARAKRIFDDMDKAAGGDGDSYDAATDDGFFADIKRLVTGPIGAAQDVASGALGWTEALGKLLANVTSGQWWLRIGIGVAGVSVLGVGVVWMFKDEIKTVVNPIGAIK
jgi:hypothetical protein